MANTRRLIKCLDAKYDDEKGYLVLNCFFQREGQRVVLFHRDDFNYRGNEVPHAEMHRTADLFRGKPFYLIVDDDPNREHVSDDQQIRYAALFNKRIAEEMDKVNKGLISGDRQVEQWKESVMKKIVRGKLR